MTIKEKLLNIQNELKAPKNQYNDFGKYNYRNAEDILEAVKPICLEHKAVLTVFDEITLIGDRFYIKATAHLEDIETNEVISVSAYAREEETKKGMDASQVTGATSSYARKYALNGLFLIDDTKDTDSEEYQKEKNKEVKQVKQPPVRTQNKMISPEQIVDLSNRLMNKEAHIRYTCEQFKVQALNQLTEANYNEIIELMNKKK